MTTRHALLTDLLQSRILILDGAMGTMIQRHQLQEADYRGSRFAGWPHDVKGNNDLLVLTRPDVIGGIHQAYLDAGADIIETNTFNATSIAMADYGMEGLVHEMNVAAARLVKELCEAETARNPAKPRFCAGVLGPTNRTCSISPDVNDPGYRNISFDELVSSYTEAIDGLVAGGAEEPDGEVPARARKPEVHHVLGVATVVDLVELAVRTLEGEEAPVGCLVGDDPPVPAERVHRVELGVVRQGPQRQRPPLVVGAGEHPATGRGADEHHVVAAPGEIVEPGSRVGRHDQVRAVQGPTVDHALCRADQEALTRHAQADDDDVGPLTPVATSAASSRPTAHVGAHAIPRRRAARSRSCAARSTELRLRHPRRRELRRHHRAGSAAARPA